MDRRRVLMLFAAAWVSAAVLTWFLYKSTSAPKQEVRTQVFAAVRDLPAGSVIRKGDLKKVAVLQKDFPKGGVVKETDAMNRVVLHPVAANEAFVTSKLSLLTGAEGIQATITPGYRAVSVQITDVSGVAGLIVEGAHVDVLFTRPGSMAEALTSTILQNVTVLAIGRAPQSGQTIDPRAPKSPVATLVVTPEQAQKLELAKNQGKISLSLRNPLDTSADLDGKPVNTDVIDPTMRAKVVQTREVRNRPDPEILKELRPVAPPPVVVKKEPPPPPPPPRAVIDVFRGDKHVQEVFRD